MCDNCEALRGKDRRLSVYTVQISKSRHDKGSYSYKETLVVAKSLPEAVQIYMAHYPQALDEVNSVTARKNELLFGEE